MRSLDSPQLVSKPLVPAIRSSDLEKLHAFFLPRDVEAIQSISIIHIHKVTFGPGIMRRVGYSQCARLIELSWKLNKEEKRESLRHIRPQTWQEWFGWKRLWGVKLLSKSVFFMAIGMGVTVHWRGASSSAYGDNGGMLFLWGNK